MNNLTICIPMYQSNFNYLKQAVQSVLDQSNPNWQLVLVDGSPKPQLHVQKWLTELNNLNIQYVINKNDRTMAGNWNYAINKSQTELVTLLHDDDKLSSLYVDKMLKFANNVPNSTAYFCDVMLIDHNNKSTWTVADSIKNLIRPKGHQITLQGDMGLSQLLKGTFIFCPTLCYRKSKLAELPFNNKWQMVADLDFYINTLLKGDQLTGVNDKLYYYRRHNQNQTTKLTNTLQRFEEEVNIYTQIEQKAINYGCNNWRNSKKTAKKMRIIKLHLHFEMLKKLITFNFKAFIKITKFYWQL